MYKYSTRRKNQNIWLEIDYNHLTSPDESKTLTAWRRKMITADLK